MKFIRANVCFDSIVDEIMFLFSDIVDGLCANFDCFSKVKTFCAVE